MRKLKDKSKLETLKILRENGVSFKDISKVLNLDVVYLQHLSQVNNYKPLTQNKISSKELDRIGDQKINLDGFDSFYGLPKVESIDNPKNKKIIKKGDFNSIGALDKLNNFLKKYKSGKLIKGLFEEKIDIFLEENPHITFSLIHIDCDIYSSTKLILNKVVDRLNVGGIILFDEIFHKDFPGETYAFLEFYQKELSLKKGIRLEFHRNTSMPWKWYCIRIQ